MHDAAPSPCTFRRQCILDFRDEPVARRTNKGPSRKMYESFFGCRQRPFTASPQVERYFPGRTIDAARQTVERCIGRAEGTALVVGPAGTGKTLLTMKLAEAFRDQLSVARLGNGGLATRRAFFQAVLYELNLPYRGLEEGELRLSLIDRLTSDAGDRGLLLIVDDAHTLPLRLLEEIRMLTDVARRGEPRVRLVLVGASSLEERLAVPRLATLQQRITARCYIEAFDRNDTLSYVRRQIAGVGGDPTQVFTEAALDAVHRATEGIPRLINQTCDHALVLGCAGGVKPIDTAGIEEAWSDLQQLPTPWSKAQGYAGPAAGGDDVIEFAAPEERDATTSFARRQPEDDGFAASPADVIELVPAPPHLAHPPTDDTLDVIETHLAEWESEFAPTADAEPEVELVLSRGRRDPFLEDFVDEEIVVDRYAVADRQPAKRVQVYGSDTRILNALAEAQQSARSAPAPKAVLHVGEESRRPAAASPITVEEDPLPGEGRDVRPHARFVKDSDPVEPEDLQISPRRPSGDAEMIIVEDDPSGDARSLPEATPVRGHDYGRMFARLRRTT
jgi:type II secretory pathway predicted ATPase ExeA